MTARLLLFNPGHENAILQDSIYYTPPGNVQRMSFELAALPLWYSASEDYILVPEESLAATKALTASLPCSTGTPVSLSTIPINQPLTAAPWGLTRTCIHNFNLVKEQTGALLDIPKWNHERKRITGRRTARECLEFLRTNYPEIHTPDLPLFTSDLEILRSYVTQHNSPLIIKVPYSSSGRGLLWVKDKGWGIKDEEWICGYLRKQGELSIESGLNKIQDFAFEYYISEEGKVQYEGISVFYSASGGAYSGNQLGSQTDLEDFLHQEFDTAYLELLKEGLGKALEALVAKHYNGYVGIDMITYRDEEDKLKIHPCIEINLRYTMGLLALHLSQSLISPGSEGKFVISYEKKPQQALELHKQDLRQSPLQWENNKISEGYMSLCPVDTDTRYRAYIKISRKSLKKECTANETASLV